MSTSGSLSTASQDYRVWGSRYHDPGAMTITIIHLITLHPGHVCDAFMRCFSGEVELQLLSALHVLHGS